MRGGAGVRERNGRACALGDKPRRGECCATDKKTRRAVRREPDGAIVDPAAPGRADRRWPEGIRPESVVAVRWITAGNGP
ncbi:hypothetical protein GCM10009802_30370 [Streptomyces synnematoformans]|uniref:Uncharacterized protein n=1 Tax=Streptomyces synnematoformans TaxID=415721 RepID=A0ABN2YCN5_9ACTN